MGLIMRKPDFAACEEQRYRPACTPVQCDQCLCSSLTEKYNRWALTRENQSSGFAINKGADQPAHPRRLISAFVNHLVESISGLGVSEISIF